MKLTVFLLFYLMFSGGTGNLEEVVDGYLKYANKQLITYSSRAAAATQDNRCYRCGVCCKEKPCRYGQWDADRHQCSYLAINQQTAAYTTYRCEKYTEIVQLETGKPLPVFGNGCRNTMYNQDREKIRHALLTATTKDRLEKQVF